MPSYNVLKQGFFAGRLYDPEGKRTVLHTDEPFPKKGNKEQVPSWLEPIKTENDTQKKKREVAEKKAAEAAAKQLEADQKEIADASFMGDGETANPVETL